MVLYDVYWCFVMFFDVLWCSMVFYDVPWCFMMFYDVLWCSMMFFVLRAFLVSFRPWSFFLKLVWFDFLGWSDFKQQLYDNNLWVLLFRLLSFVSSIECGATGTPCQAAFHCNQRIDKKLEICDQYKISGWREYKKARERINRAREGRKKDGQER